MHVLLLTLLLGAATPVEVQMLDGTTLDENAAGAEIGTLATNDPDAGDAHSYTVSDDRFEVIDGTL